MKCISPIILTKGLDFKKYPDGLKVPCGQCLQCKKRKKGEWSLRMLHELEYWKESCFITLTYMDKYLPDNNSLSKHDLMLFIKRLRTQNKPFKYFAVGEYGSKQYSNRPHYHLIMYGYGLNTQDKQNIIDTWRYMDWSQREIRKNAFGVAEPKSIQYVSGYMDKKFNGQLEFEEYTLSGRENQFKLASNGLGKRFCIDNAEQISALGYISQYGVKYGIPRYYLKQLNLPEERLNEIKSQYDETDRETVNYVTGIWESEIELYKRATKEEYQRYDEVVKRCATQRELEIKQRTERR